MDNTKTFWEAHKEVYATAVAAPMRALVAALADEFGEARIYRPYRDVRFAKDKTPYKTHQGAFVAKGPSTGYYVQVGAPGVRVGSGFYEASPTRLASIREAIVDDRRGRELEEILAALRSSGWEIGGNRLKTAPRGYDVEHPRIDLLRHKSMNVGKSYGFEPVIHTPELVDRVRADWREVTPLVEWFLRYARG
ncbi:TIGR02453 family protein [Aeromicrobium sp. SMF47]|nr:TIGR02453 family protein [Aeromicrobium yanjiei]